MQKKLSGIYNNNFAPYRSFDIKCHSQGCTVTANNFDRMRMATNGTVARIILALTLGLFVYYFLWVSVVPFLLVEEGNRRMSPHV